MKKRIAMIVYNEIDYDGRVQRSAIALSKKYHVTVISIDSGRNYYNDNFSTKAIKLPDIKRLKKVRLFLFWLKVTPYLIQFKPHICYSHDYFLSFSGVIWSYLTQCKYIYDAHELIIPEKKRKQSKREKFFYLLEKFSVKHANMIIAANRERSQLMKMHYGLKNIPFVIRNIPQKPEQAIENINHYYPILKNKKMNDIWLVYQGDMSFDRGIKKFLIAMQHTNSQFRLILIGGGPDMIQIKKIITERKLDNKIVLLGKIPRDHLYSVLKICNIGIVTYPFQDLNNIYCASNKIFEYAQAGLAVISTCQPPLRSIIEKYKFGILLGCNKNRTISTENILDAIQNLSDKYNLDDNIYQFLYDNQWDNEAEKLINIVRRLCV